MTIHILFLCTGNLCRSPLAEGIFKHKLAERGIESMIASSAGTFAMGGNPAASHAIAVATECGIDISAHRTRHVTREMLRGADMVICAGTDHILEAGVVLEDTDGRHRLLSDFGPPEGRGSDIEDPYGGSREFFKIVRDRIEQCVDGLISTLLASPPDGP